MIKVEEFKEQCIKLRPHILVQRYLIESPTFFFSGKNDEEFDFKKDIASILDVHIRDIVVVGSGKLGFSLKPDPADNGLYLFKTFDHNYKLYGKKSDLDIAVVSSSLFDKQLKNLYDFTGYYKNPILTDRNQFGKYILKGRFAIRFLPIDFPLTKDILKVQAKYKMNYGRDINIEIYKSWYFFETYHESNIRNIQINLIK